MAFSLIPKETKFFSLFESQASHICEAARVFQEALSQSNLDPTAIKTIRDIEHEADINTHEIIDKLNRTFITPFDREDIHELASEMDDVVDLIQGAASRMHLYRITKATEELAQLGETLYQATEMVKKAVMGLNNLKSSRRILDYCIEINRLENAGDQLVELALGKLFSNHQDPLEVMKWKEIYEITEEAIDKCEDVANVVESIVVKQG
ncbi:MAG: DUF47 domain-containing protein [Elusimicrobia bacterium]|nr:DUF47 domain-containing protein [Elusimicrobiota bacterium]